MQQRTMLKQDGRLVLLLSLLLVALVALSGCAPRATGGQLAASAAEADLVIDFPALVIDVQEDGQATVGGQAVAELGAMAGQDLSAVSIPSAQVDFLVTSNIQHIQVDNTTQGILILVNGVPIPSIAWDGDKLVATGQVLQSLGGGVALLDKLLPLVRNFGMGLIIRFPIAEGTEPLPLVAPGSPSAEAALRAQQEFLAAVGTPPTFQLGLTYDEDGTWNAGDLSPDELSQLAPIPWDTLNLTPDQIQAVSDAGVEEISIYTNPNGIFIAVNGNELPYITWSEARVENVLDLIEQTGLLGADPNMSAVMDTVRSLLPAVQASNVRLNVMFP